MMESLEIHGYRCFESFRMGGLGRVNLLVGKNNSGKTALLEAVHAGTMAGRDLSALWGPLIRRGECFPDGDRGQSGPQLEYRNSGPRAEYDVSHLFYGRAVGRGTAFQVILRGPEPVSEQNLAVEVTPQEGPPTGPVGTFTDEEGTYYGKALRVAVTGRTEPITLPLTVRGGLDPGEWISEGRHVLSERTDRYTTYIPPDSLSPSAISSYWRSIALTPEEDLVLLSLRILALDVDRVAFVGLSEPRGASARGGLLLRRKGSDRPVPIGSLGDGVWRMFGLSIGLVRSCRGILLVDEIDSGLHYLAMHDMWWLVLRAAERLDVQVFATTHSLDCIRGLAEVCQDAPAGSISLQRLELGKPEAVTYPQEDIPTAARQGIETR